MKKDRATPPPVADLPDSTTPDLSWLAPLADAATQAHTAYAETVGQQAALRAHSTAVPYVEKAREPVEIARAALPGLEQYQAATAPIREAACAMGLDIGSQSLVARADAGGIIRNIREAVTTYDTMQNGQYAGNLDAALAVILLQVKAAERQLDGYRVHFETLVQAMQETALARAKHPLSAGPTVEIPARPRGEPVGPPTTDDFNPFDFGRK